MSPSAERRRADGHGYIASSLTEWEPHQEYKACHRIGDIEPGPGALRVVGRVANLSVPSGGWKKPRNARACVWVLLKDGTGALAVKIWYAIARPVLRLGQLCTLWTVFVSIEDASAMTPSAFLVSSIFPEADSSGNFTIVEPDDGELCKDPIGYTSGEILPRLISLMDFGRVGHEIVDCILLVCVKSVSVRKKCTNRFSQTRDKIEVVVFDDTAEATLLLWGLPAASASDWRSTLTTLLITDPSLKASDPLSISVTAGSLFDVDPQMTEATGLRKLAQSMMVKERVNAAFPSDVFDIYNLFDKVDKDLYTLAALDSVSVLPSSEADI
ncbi:MAG: hypothetical protein M1833_003882 [Piccolia ochrophora]|nr:MAG: hypothetical protein M1833_003882 [Piccolia ochrophora]